MKKYFLPFLILTILLAVWLRFNQLGKIPTSLYWDEVAMLVDAKSVAETGRDMHGNSWLQVLFPSYGDYKLPIYIWLAGLSIKLLGASELVLRLPSVLVGILTIVVSALIARDLFSLSKKSDRWLWLSTALVVALSPWSIMFSRAGFEGHLAQLFLAVSLWLVLKARKKSWLAMLSPLVAILATYTYFSVRFVWPGIFLIMTIFIFGKKFWRWAVPGLLVFSLLLLPMLRSPLYAASQQFRYSTTSVLNAYDYPVLSNQLREQAGNHWYDRIFFHRQSIMAKELFKNYADHLSFNYLFVTGDDNLRHGTGSHGLYLLAFLPIFILGLYHLFDKYRAQLGILVSWWLIALLPASVPETTPHSLRSLNALVPISIIIGFGLYQFLKLKPNLVNRFIQIFWSCLLVINLLQFNHFYFNIYPHLSAAEWQAGYKELAIDIKQESPHVADIYVREFDNRFYLWLLAYGSHSAEEIQQLEKKDYQVKSLDNIHFEKFDWTKLESLDRKILVADQAVELDRQLLDNRVVVSRSIGIFPYKLVLIEPQ